MGGVLGGDDKTSSSSPLISSRAWTSAAATGTGSWYAPSSASPSPSSSSSSDEGLLGLGAGVCLCHAEEYGTELVELVAFLDPLVEVEVEVDTEPVVTTVVGVLKVVLTETEF